jgi:hypothetical protein
MPVDAASAQESPRDTQIPLWKLRAADLNAVLTMAHLKPAALALIAGCQTVPEALQRLDEGGMPRQAVRIVAHGLPAREAVWWACMCARHTAPADLAESDRLALDAAEAWVRRPSDELRQTAAVRAADAEVKSPEVWAARAVDWSGAPATPPESKRRIPSRRVAGTAVLSAVIQAALRTTPKRSGTRLEQFLESARDIASGGGGRLPPEAP